MLHDQLLIQQNDLPIDYKENAIAKLNAPCNFSPLKAKEERYDDNDSCGTDHEGKLGQRICKRLFQNSKPTKKPARSIIDSDSSPCSSPTKARVESRRKHGGSRRVSLRNSGNSISPTNTSPKCKDLNLSTNNMYEVFDIEKVDSLISSSTVTVSNS